MSPDHQIFHRCIQHLQLPSSNTVLDWHILFWACRPVSLSFGFQFYFSIILLAQCKAFRLTGFSVSEPGQESRGPGELHILGLCLQGTGSMRKWFGKFGLQLSAMLSIMVDAWTMQGSTRDWTPAVEAWGLNHWTTREGSSFGFVFCFGV